VAEELVVGVFDEETEAWDAVIAATEVAAQRQSGILDACLVVRRSDGSVQVRETSDLTPTQGAWYGAATGLVAGVVLAFPLAGAAVGAGLGVFAARRHDVGITNDFEHAVAERLEPGKAAAVALVHAEIASDVEAAARRRGAWTRRVTLEEARKTTAS
jgi:uncharacterized membrane protein